METQVLAASFSSFPSVNELRCSGSSRGSGAVSRRAGPGLAGSKPRRGVGRLRGPSARSAYPGRGRGRAQPGFGGGQELTRYRDALEAGHAGHLLPRQTLAALAVERSLGLTAGSRVKPRLQEITHPQMAGATADSKSHEVTAVRFEKQMRKRAVLTGLCLSGFHWMPFIRSQ